MGFRDLMNNYYYGKQGKADYTVENMPQTRLQLFGEVLKVRWSALFGVNLLYMIAWIPAIVWTVINALALVNLPEGGTVDQMTGLVFTWLMVMIPCIAITGPFNAGVSYVLRNWARDEHSFVLSDFKDAVKANWKQALIMSLIDGVMPFVLFTGWRFYGSMIQNSMIYVVPLGLLMLVGIIWALASMLAYPMLITYELKTRDVIRNSVLLSVAKLPFAVLIKLLTFAVPAVGIGLGLLIPSIQWQILGIVALLYLVWLVAFNKLIVASYANWLFETYLNPNIEGARSNIGLRPEDWDDVTYIPEDDED